MRYLLSIILLLLSNGTALAHTGHGIVPASRTLHYFIEGVHAIPILILVAAIVVARWRRAARRARG